MKFLNKSFFAGVLVGMVLTVCAVAAGSFLFYASLIRQHGGPSKFFLQPAPEFPEAGIITPLRAGEDWAVRDLSGAPLSLREQRGNVVFLNRWATWCHPCVAEMPSIQALYDSLHAEGVVFALVSDGEPAVVRRFVERRSFRVPVYVSQGKEPAAYGSAGIPATFILDRAGNVVAEHVGAANWDVERCRRYLRRLLAR